MADTTEQALSDICDGMNSFEKKMESDTNFFYVFSADELQSKEGVGEIKRLGRLSPIDVCEVRTLYQCQG